MLAYMQAKAVTKGYPSLGLPFGKTVIFTQAGINISQSNYMHCSNAGVVNFTFKITSGNNNLLVGTQNFQSLCIRCIGMAASRFALLLFCKHPLISTLVFHKINDDQQTNNSHWKMYRNL